MRRLIWWLCKISKIEVIDVREHIESFRVFEEQNKNLYYKNSELKLENKKLTEQLKYIIESEEAKPEVREVIEIVYITKGLKSIVIKSESEFSIPLEDARDNMKIKSLNDLLIKLLPYISCTIKTEGSTNTSEQDKMIIINELSILTTI